MTMLGIRTHGQILVSEHTKKYAADARETLEDCHFLRYLRAGLREYLGTNSPLDHGDDAPLAIELEDCRHCFGALYPVTFTIVLSISYEGTWKTYRLHFKARQIEEKSYTLESCPGGTALGALPMRLDAPDENTRTYRKIIERFQWQFGEKGTYRLNIDNDSWAPMPDAAATPCDAEGTGAA